MILTDRLCLSFHNYNTIDTQRMLNNWPKFNVSDLSEDYLTDIFPNAKFVFVTRDPKNYILWTDSEAKVKFQIK